jgi:hypothetical protein
MSNEKQRALLHLRPLPQQRVWLDLGPLPLGYRVLKELIGPVKEKIGLQDLPAEWRSTIEGAATAGKLRAEREAARARGVTDEEWDRLCRLCDRETFEEYYRQELAHKYIRCALCNGDLESLVWNTDTNQLERLLALHWKLIDPYSVEQIVQKGYLVDGVFPRYAHRWVLIGDEQARGFPDRIRKEIDAWKVRNSLGNAEKAVKHVAAHDLREFIEEQSDSHFEADDRRPSETELQAAAKQYFAPRKIPRQLWREAFSHLPPEKRRRRGDTDRKLKAKRNLQL